MKEIYLLLNPHAAGGRARRLVPELTRWAAARPNPPPLCQADSVAQARQWLLGLPRGSTVALVGGDGTVNQMLPALLDNDLQLALIPQGSGNDLARALGLAGLHWRDALQQIDSHRPLRMDVGWLQTPQARTPFASSLTVGFDSAVGHQALRGPRWLRGLPRYLLATLRELLALQTWDMQIWLDGQALHQGTTLFASTLNTPSYGSGMPAVPHARVDDGALDLLIAGRFNRPQVLAMLPRLLLGRHLSHPRVQTQRFQSLRIASAQPLPLAADGEYLGGALDFTLSVAPGALRVLRP